MMKQLWMLLLAAGACLPAFSQELFVFTEPASNMARGAIGFRLNQFLMPLKSDHGNRNSYRVEPEIMWGASKNWMLHLAGYASNMFGTGMKMEGGSLYAKYRFLSRDEIHSHFRMAAFAKLAIINNPVSEQVTVRHQYLDALGNPYFHDQTEYVSSNQLNIDGDHTGYQLGVVATELSNKLALSGSASYMYRLNNLGGHPFFAGDTRNAINLSASAGYLLLPKAYKDYAQTNVNLYLELLGSQTLDGNGYSVDAAPAVQFIFNSIARLDLGYRFQVAGNVTRHYGQNFLLRLEYNWLNAVK